MKRLCALLLAGLLFCTCSACKKETAAAPAASGGQTVDAASEWLVSGVSVRVPAGQFRLARTVMEGMTFGNELLPYPGGAVLTGQLLTQGEAGEDVWTSVSASYTPDRVCTVQEFPVDAGGGAVAAALEEGRFLWIESCGSPAGTHWTLHDGARQTVLDEALSGISVLDAMAVRDGTLYLAADSACVLACSADGTLLWKQPAARIERFFCARDGSLLTWSREEQTIGILENDAFRTLCSLPALFCTGTERLYSGESTPYDCLVFANDACFGWSIRENAVTQLFTCDAVGLYAADVEAFCGMEGGRYLGLEYSPSEDGTPAYRLFWMTPVEGKLPETRVVRVAGGRSGIFSMAVRDFTSQYPEYRIEYVDYDALYGEQAAQQLLMDMLYGDCPDLLFVNALPFVQYARRGLLEDLYTWLDADKTLSRADLTPNLLRALETDGALYRLPQTYLLETAAGKPEITGGNEGWTMADFLDTAQAHPELNAIFAQDDGASMLQLLLLHAPETFVDYEAAEARFDSPEFLRLMKLAKDQTRPEAESPREALLTGQTLLEALTIGHAQSFAQEYADGLGQLSFPGFPGAGRAEFYLTLPMAIPANAQEKEGAWAFLKLLMTESLYAARGRGGWLPVQADFEEKTAAMQDREARELLRALQAEASTTFYCDEAIQGILSDELPYYFADEQTAAQIAERIQRRAQLYLEEAFR